MIGFLSHLTFVMCYGAAFIWSVCRLACVPQRLYQRVFTLAQWHTVPLLILTCLAWGFVSGMVHGRGQRNDFLTAAVETISAWAGGSLELPWAYPVALLALAAATASVVTCWRADRWTACLMVLTILVTPCLVLVSFPIDFYSVRYLQVPGQTLALLVAREAAAAFSKGPWLLSFALALVFSGAHLARDAVLISRGRGGYRHAVQHMLDTTPAPEGVIAIYSNHEFRTRLLLEYHQPSTTSRRFHLYHDRELPPAGAEWYLLNDTRHGGSGKPYIADHHGNIYRRDLVVRGGGIAPIHWYLYRRSRLPPSGP